MDGVVGAGDGADARPGGGVQGHAAAARVSTVTDRRAAIAQAIACAGDGDVVVIAGKGHEQGQEFANGRKLPFDDVTVAREALRERTVGHVRTGASGARVGVG